MHLRPHEQLIVWKESHELCVWTYGITRDFPSSEKFGLTNQMRRSAYSVPTNIAEGNAKRTHKDKARYFEIALGSLEELHYQFVLSKDLQYINQAIFLKADDHIQRVSFLLTKLRGAFVPSSVASVASESSVAL